MAAAISLPIVILIMNILMNYSISNELLYFSIFAAALVVYTHRSNINRLLKGEEKPFKRICNDDRNLPSNFNHEDTRKEGSWEAGKIGSWEKEGRQESGK
jgi:hypothetical protein